MLPDGRQLIEEFSLAIHTGEVAVLLGGSGSGKSTFSRVLFEPEVLERDGFVVEAKALAFERGELGLVPQRGALFDHLDVRGNLEIAARYGADPDDNVDPGLWLERVGLDPSLADRSTPVANLSGGQAQRVAVARALAGNRRLLFLDEPSVGLDPHRVRVLARLIRDQADKLGVGVLVVTHDVALASGVADELYVLDPITRRLERLFADTWPGAMERDDVSEETRSVWMSRLESELVRRIANAERRRSASSHDAVRSQGMRFGLVTLARTVARPFSAAAASLRAVPSHFMRRRNDFKTVAARVIRQSVVRPLAFYSIVSVLIGYTILFVISKVGGAGVRPDFLIRQIGGSYVVALAPALSAILFVAASGSATNAWLGSMSLTRQILALEALGVDSEQYLWAPAWVAIALSYLAVAVLFAMGMLLGGLILCHQYGVPSGWEVLSADFFDPRPSRIRFVVRAVLLVWSYAWGIASDVVAKGTAEKREADDVTRGMTGSVVACTLWVVAWELATAVVAFSV